MSAESWTHRLMGGLAKTTERLTGNLAGITGGDARLSEDQLDDLEDALILSDLGPRAAARIRERLPEPGLKGADETAIRVAVAEEIAAILRPVAKPLEVTAFPRPHVVLVIGVNGRQDHHHRQMAHLFQEEDYAVMLAAGDTFRAAAIGQLGVWADRLGVPIVKGPEGGDPASSCLTR
jgi:fused signal recognition particle receptor